MAVAKPDDKLTKDDYILTPLVKTIQTWVKNWVEWRLDRLALGATGKKFDKTPSADLILELMARGYAVWKPSPEGKE